jgi:hypothetical protein
LIPSPDTSPSIALIDHVVVAMSRVLKQYQNSPKFIAYLATLPTLSNQLESVLQSLLLLPSIDAMSGVNLDIIGIIVGQSRFIPDSILIPFFGFADTPDGQNFGELGDQSVGAPWYENGESFLATTSVPDVAYRILLRTRIIKNASSGTPENIMDALAYLFDVKYVNCEDTAPMHLELTVGRLLSLLEKAMYLHLDILPRPAGVILDGLITFDATDVFGFAGSPFALGFGELSNPTVGGSFAEIST